MRPITMAMVPILVLGVAGCDLFRFQDRARPDPTPAAGSTATPQSRRAPDVTAPPRGVTTTVASLDTVSDAEKAEARAAAAADAGAALGTETVSLGSPTEPGLWVKTALVSEDTPGTVRTGGGDAVAVTLRPLEGAGGAQISLSALQALGLPLAGLHPLALARSS